MSIPAMFAAKMIAHRFNSPAVIKIMKGNFFDVQSSTELSRVLTQLFDEKVCRFEYIKEIELNFEQKSVPTLLVLPGSTSISKWSFSKDQQKQIQSLYESGVLKIIGVCAGAFYSSREVVYGGAQGTRSLVDIFKGACVGPAYEGNAPAIGRVTVQIKPLLIKESGQLCNATMNGGGYFDLGGVEDKELVKVKAVYESGQPAVISCTPKPGMEPGAVLMGPHLEYDSSSDAFTTFKEAFPLRKDEFEKMQEKLRCHDMERVEFLADLIADLGFT